jgi:hypothetical protein
MFYVFYLFVVDLLTPHRIYVCHAGLIYFIFLFIYRLSVVQNM